MISLATILDLAKKLEAMYPGISLEGMTPDSIVAMWNSCGHSAPAYACEKADEALGKGASEALKKALAKTVTLHYYYGTLSETFTLDNEKEEFVFAVIKQFFDMDRTKSKSAMFETLFKGCSLCRITPSKDGCLDNYKWFYYNLDSVKINWSIKRMISYLAFDMQNEYYDWGVSCERFFENALKWLNTYSEVLNNPEIKSIFSTLGFSEDEMRKAA